MQATNSTLTIDVANVQFAPYCYLRPNTKTYRGLSEAGIASVKDIMGRIARKEISGDEGTREGKANVMNGKTLEFTDWTERSKRVREALTNNPADVVLLQEVSQNRAHKLATIDDIIEDSCFTTAKYSNFPLKLVDEEEHKLEEVLQRGTAVALHKNIVKETDDSIAITLNKNGGKKIQTRQASIATFTLNVHGTELKVRAVSVHITGYSSWDLKNRPDLPAKIAANPDDVKLKKGLENANIAFECCKEGMNELTHYLNELDREDVVAAVEQLTVRD